MTIRSITVRLDDGGTRPAHLPEPSADRVLMDGACPVCGTERPEIFGAHGPDGPERGHDTLTTLAVHTEPHCRARIGRLVVQVETLFGLDEDEAVLAGRPRVY